MAYKSRFAPIEGFIGGEWRRLAPEDLRIAMLYALARPLLFALDPETAHHLALKSPASPALFAAQPPACPGARDGAGFPQPGRPRRRAGQAGRARRCARRARFRLPRTGRRHAAPAAGQSAPAHVPHSARRSAIINRYGLNSVGVDAFVENLKNSNIENHHRRQHRQEQGHAEREGRGRLRNLPGEALSARRLRDAERLFAQHRRVARPAGARRLFRHLLSRMYNPRERNCATSTAATSPSR